MADFQYVEANYSWYFLASGKKRTRSLHALRLVGMTGFSTHAKDHPAWGGLFGSLTAA